jgi:ribose transport system substrate-binding protein
MATCKLVALAGGAAVALMVAPYGTASGRKLPPAKNVAKFETPVPGSGKGVKIGFNAVGGTDPNTVAEEAGMRWYAKKVGADLFVCNNNQDTAKALDCARQMKQRGVQVILNGQIDAHASAAICAAGPKVPTIALDIPQKPCMVSFVGSDNRRAGYLAGVAAGQYFKQHFACKPDAIVSMEVQVAGQVNTDRVTGELQGFESVCGKQRNVRHVDTNNTPEQSLSKFTDVLTAIPNAHKIMVFAIADPPALGALAAAKSQRRLNDIYIMAQSASPASLCQIKTQPHWLGDTAYFTAKYAYIAIPWAIRLVHGQKMPPVLHVPHVVITKANIAKYYNVSNC